MGPITWSMNVELHSREGKLFNSCTSIMTTNANKKTSNFHSKKLIGKQAHMGNFSFPTEGKVFDLQGLAI